MTLKWHGCVVVALAIVLSSSPVHAQKMYWSSRTGIQRANLDGSDVEVVVSDAVGGGGFGIAVDSASGKIYWTNAGRNTIQRANLDGTRIETLITTGLNQPWGIALDLLAGKMYWANRLGGNVQRANLDGTFLENVVVGVAGPTGVALDVEGRRIYWTTGTSGRIQRASLDGSNIETIISRDFVPIPDSIALDVVNCKIYYTLADTLFVILAGGIQRANLDGSGVEDVFPAGLGLPSGIAVDVSAAKVYWVDTFDGRIRRANVDGSGIEDLVATSPLGAITLDLELSRPIPTLSVWGLVIMALCLLTLARVLKPGVPHSSPKAMGGGRTTVILQSPTVRCANNGAHGPCIVHVLKQREGRKSNEREALESRDGGLDAPGCCGPCIGSNHVAG